MEVAGLVIGVVGLAGLFKTALEAWEFVDAGRAQAENFSYFRTRLDNQRAIFLIWAESLGFFSPDCVNKAINTPKRRAYQVGETLKHIALLFSNTYQLISEYGFKVHQDAVEISFGSKDVSSPAIFQQKYHNLTALVRQQRGTKTFLNKLRADTQRQQDSASIWEKCKWSIRDEKKSFILLDKISALVDDLEKLTRDIEVTKTSAQLASETVQNVSEGSLLEIEESSKDKETIISSAASLRLRSIEGRTIATANTAAETFVTAETSHSGA